MVFPIIAWGAIAAVGTAGSLLAGAVALDQTEDVVKQTGTLALKASLLVGVAAVGAIGYQKAIK